MHIEKPKPISQPVAPGDVAEMAEAQAKAGLRPEGLVLRGLEEALYRVQLLGIVGVLVGGSCFMARSLQL